MNAEEEAAALAELGYANMAEFERDRDKFVAGMNDFMEPGRPFVVFCAAPIHEPLDVVTLYPDGILQSMFHAALVWLEEDTVFGGTLADAAMRERQAVVQGTDRPNFRRRYRLVCPVCGDRGAVVELRDHHLAGFRQLLDMSPSVSRMDISVLARYLS